MVDSNCKMVVDKHIEKFKTLDVLVNNASKQIQCADLAEIDLDNVRSTFHSNVVAMFAMTKYDTCAVEADPMAYLTITVGFFRFSLPYMKRGSSIVNSSSVTAYKGSAAMVDYSATKGASAFLCLPS